MGISSTLVNVAEDADHRLVTVLGESAGEAFHAECMACLNDGGDTEKLIKTIISSAPAMQTLMHLEQGEAIAVVSLLAGLVKRSKACNISYVALSIVDAICNETHSIPSPSGTAGEEDLSATKRKITMVSVLYNMLDVKCPLLNRMVEVAGKHPAALLHPETILGRLLTSPNCSAFSNATSTSSTTATTPPIVTLLDSWEDAVTVEDRRALYSTVCKVLPETDSRKQRFVLLLVETYTTMNEVDAVGMAAAKDAAVGAIRDPVTLFRQQRDLLSRPAIQALRKDNADLCGLLTVFQEGKLVDYEAFVAEKDAKTLFAQWNLEPAHCERYIRILSLCSLASEHEEIPYMGIAETLKLSSGTDQVESWVIAAVNSGLLQAKMDQLAQKVVVERSVVRQFDMEQWKNLQTRLSSWKEHVGSIVAALKQSQAAATLPN